MKCNNHTCNSSFCGNTYAYQKKIIHQGFPYPVCICKVIHDIYLLYILSSYGGCSKLREPSGQMVDHLDRSYFKTHVNNNSQAHCNKNERAGEKVVNTVIVFNDDTGININKVNGKV